MPRARRLVLLPILVGGLSALLPAPTAVADTVFLYSSGRDIHGVNLEQSTESYLTRAPQAANVNALAANPDQGLVYYGDGTRAYRWDLAQGAGSGAHTLMTDFASGPLTAPIHNIDSTGGSYIAGNWYVASEDDSGFIEEIYRIGLSADGRQAVSATPLGLLAACGCSSVQLGGFGDIAVREEGGTVVIYGSSADLTGTQALGTAAGRWRFMPSAGTWQFLGAGNGGQLSSSADGRLYTNTGTTVRELDALNGSTGPALYNASHEIWDFTRGISWDFGDAPDTYGVAIHAIDANNLASPHLGQLPPDNDYFTLNADAGFVAGLGDDDVGVDDEDALGLIAPIESSSNNYTVTVQCSPGSKVSAWLDIDADGVFSLDERNSNYPSNCGSGSVELRWNSLNGISILSGSRFLRIRTASDITMITEPYGFAPDGEVEDYTITVSNAQSGSCPAGLVSTLYGPTDLPLAIGPGRRKVTRSVINVPGSLDIADVNVLNVQGSHTWMSDLTFHLVHDTTGVALFGPSCGSSDDFFFSFDDEASGTPPCPPIDGSTYPPIGSLSDFDGMDAQGDWTLQVTDLYNGDGGQLDAWVLEICSVPVVTESPDVRLGKSAIVNGDSVTINLSLENTGDVTLDNLQVRDNLDAVFGAGNYHVSVPPSLLSGPAGFAENTAYTGNSANLALLSTTSPLAPGERIDLSFGVVVDNPFSGSVPGEFLNQAETSAVSPAGTSLLDLSGDGLDLSTDNDIPTPIVIELALRLSGTLFEDSSDAGSGDHDGVRQADEAAVPAQRIEVRRVDDGTLLGSVTSDAAGDWSVSLPTSLAGTAIDIVYAGDPAYQVVGEASAYAGASVVDGVLRIDALGLQHYAGLDVGLVHSPVFQAPAVLAAAPGARLIITHQYVAPTRGNLAVTLDAATMPASPAWPGTVVRDDNCNGTRDAAESPLTGSLPVDRGQPVCLLVELFVPASAPAGAEWRGRIDAALTLSPWAALEAPPVLPSALEDVVTVVAGQGVLTLEKRVRNLTRGEAAGVSNRALPGEVLEYAIHFRNTGNGPLGDLTVNDQTPAFTVLDAGSPSCDVVPASLQCVPGVAGDSLAWQFTGMLAAGEGGSLSYRVTVE